MKSRPIALLLVLASCHCARAAGTQIGDLRIGATTYSTLTYFDPGFSETTRSVTGAPVQVNSSFIGASQNSGGASPDSATDIGLQTYSSVTVIRQLNRYASDPDGPGGALGPQTVGAVQWTIDLSPIDGYLASNSLDLTALDLRLVTDPNGGSSPSGDEVPYDVYLSYTNTAELISLASLATGTTAGTENYHGFWLPAQSTAEGGVANGTHKVVELGFTGDMDLTIDLLALYEAGITDFNLIMTSGGFFSGRTIGIGDGSGLSIDTAPVPEPSAAILGLLGGMFLLRRRRF